VFPGGSLSLVGANSPSGLASKPIRILISDEIGRFPVSAGDEGDPLGLGEFGAITEGAVRGFQRIRGLITDGVVGQKTWNKLYWGVASAAPILVIVIFAYLFPEVFIKFRRRKAVFSKYNKYDALYQNTSKEFLKDVEDYRRGKKTELIIVGLITVDLLFVELLG
jgi:hypothetical protein